MRCTEMMIATSASPIAAVLRRAISWSSRVPLGRYSHNRFGGAFLFALGVLAWPGRAAAVPFVYVANYLDGTVSVVDTATNSETARVSVGGAPLSVAVNPAGTRVYVAAPGSAISVIDTATNSVIAT